MKTINYFFVAGLFCLSPVLNGCSSYEENDGDPERLDRPGVIDLTSEKGQNPDDIIMDSESSHSHMQGYVYTIGNETEVNRIHIYRQDGNGALAFQGTIASGGTGTGTALESQGALVLDRKNNYLYAVNPGDNTISSFFIQSDGNPMLMHTAASGGMIPVSLTINQGRMYVVNAGSNDIGAFHLGSHGSFSYIPGSKRALSSTSAAPAQISFSPNGDFVYVAEKGTDMISGFRLKSDDTPGDPITIHSAGKTPFGFSFSRNFMVVSNAEMGVTKASTVSSYSGANQGLLSVLSAGVANMQTAACWVATTLHGRYVFVTNTGTDNISSYYVGPRGKLYLLEGEIASGNAPIDIEIASDNVSVYVLCAQDHTLRSYLRTRAGGLEPTGQVSGVAPSAAGLAAW